MKHLLNNMSEEEKNSIREQHSGGMKLNNEKFNSLVEKKLGDVKPILKEQVSPIPQSQADGQRLNCLMEQFPTLKQFPQSCDGVLGSIPKTMEHIINYPIKMAACLRELKQASGVPNEEEMMKKITAVQSCMMKNF